MLHAKIGNTPEDGRKALTISSVKGQLPRVSIKPCGLGEPFDVIGPTGDAYGTLVKSGDSSAILSYGNQPIMKISKIRDFPELEMTATTMDTREIANAGPNGNGMWNLTVSKGVDAVLVCACMLGMLIF